ncbi:two-partner secretion domain-containing protein [Pseudomonas sp. KNUC1026]|uniref:two-partner secretion domain-containing protein n=1 Tax=Pseudomonas sp. KNUC1026 TaxID=2893890 RepID=UPI001F3FFCB1|nr:filamentous hemagglutinin N-terminal domain-containing protein [Pseudomonas sp. KNUC1026]UFH49299.1 filamentous hemagglutinin N-terminal domain-containing protein [Pseudomonas sp. KNUC1026]
MDARQLAFLARLPSARLIERQRFWGLPKRGIALILINALFWQPIWAQAEGIAVSGGTNTSVSQAGNGVPIVNIAAPNAAGLSHNQYQQYNVGSEGVILNNATGKTASTQQGGIILGNGNLGGRAAGTILNEVVGANPSQLKGYTEVAGQGARVIVANPHGVTCDGCGFINTPRATLTTGTPVLNGNGQLDHFQVDDGNVAIEGQGLDASQVGQFEIITRAAQINAQINAQQLAVVAGRNDVDAQTLNATPRAGNGSAAPTVAIDSSALGGMYAGSIKLVGTEAGVGVRVAGNLAASAGDIQLGANGQLTVGQVAATGAVSAKAASANIQGTVYGSSVDVQTTGALNIQQNVAARDRINLASNGQITNSAIVEAGVNADNSRNATAQLTVTAQNLRNSGSLSASHTVQATASQALNNQGGTLSGQASTQVSAGTLDNRSGRVLSQNALTATAGQVLNGQGGLIGSANTVTLNADQLSNGGGEISSQGTLTAQGRQADNSSNGRVLANGDLTLNYATLANQGGRIAGQQSVNLNLGSLDNSAQGSVKAARNVNLAATGAVNNSQGGELVAGSALTLASASLDNSQNGRIAGAGVAVQTGALNNRGASLTSSGALALTAAQVDNSAAGRIASAMALTASMTGLDQHSGGQLFSNSDLSLDLNHGQLDNQGGLINALGVVVAQPRRREQPAGRDFQPARLRPRSRHPAEQPWLAAQRAGAERAYPPTAR